MNKKFNTQNINNKKILFISDLHLNSKVDLLQKFVDNYTQDIDEIYILGDLFNLYLGDDLIGNHYLKVVNILKSIKCRVFIMRGNRDFLIGDKFAKLAKINLINEPYICQDYVLMHGDSLVIDDKKYQFFKKIIQNPLIKFILLHLPKKYRQNLATKIRIKTQQSKSTKDYKIMDVNDLAVVDYMQNYPDKNLIHGHTHKQNIHQYHNFKRFVLGDWRENIGNALLLDDGKIKFITIK